MLSRQTLAESPLFASAARESHLQQPASSLRLSSTCYYQTQEQASPDSGSNQQAARGLSMRRSDNDVDGSDHVEFRCPRAVAWFVALLFNKAARRTFSHPQPDELAKDWCCVQMLLVDSKTHCPSHVGAFNQK